MRTKILATKLDIIELFKKIETFNKFKFVIIQNHSSKNIFGCFVSNSLGTENNNEEERALASQLGSLFRSYLWGNKGIEALLKAAVNTDYGEDLVLILYQFYINPVEQLLNNLKPIEPYRDKEKSIGIPIIVNHENFFNKSEEDRYIFIKESVLEKLDILKEIIIKNKLDTNIKKLKSDLKELLEQWRP